MFENGDAMGIGHPGVQVPFNGNVPVVPDSMGGGSLDFPRRYGGRKTVVFFKLIIHYISSVQRRLK